MMSLIMPDFRVKLRLNTVLCLRLDVSFHSKEWLCSKALAQQSSTVPDSAVQETAEQPVFMQDKVFSHNKV